MGCHFLLQGIFPIQGLNLHLLCVQVDYLPLSHLESPDKTNYKLADTALFQSWMHLVSHCDILEIEMHPTMMPYSYNQQYFFFLSDP